VKGNYIEVHLGDGGATTRMLAGRLPECGVGDPSDVGLESEAELIKLRLSSTINPPTKEERERLQAELADLRRKIDAAAKADATREATCPDRIKQEAVKLGSRFNVRYDSRLSPAQLTPESLRAALRDYIDFSGDTPSVGPLDWAKPGIVKIAGTIGPAVETGAGIVIGVDGRAALVLTAHHVVNGAKDLKAMFYGRSYDAFEARQFERFHGDLDLALLIIEPPPGKSLPQDVPVFAVRDLSRLREGESVAAIGHPQDLDWQVTRNTIARLTDPDDARKVLITRSGFDRGYSGGPLLDAEGQLIGMTTRMTALHAVAVKFDAIRAVLREWNISATTKLR
jgi:S1-C subfamily serine protease